MGKVEALCAQMTTRVAQLSGDKLHSKTALPQVRLTYTNYYHARQPVIYNPSIVILFQGRKAGYLGSKTFFYDPANYLMLTVPLPFECETFASEQEPVAGISISIDTAMLQDLLMDMGDEGFVRQPDHSSGVTSGSLDEDILCAAQRLLDIIDKPLHVRILGPKIIREILFFILVGENGGALQALVNRHTHFAQIAKSLRRIENHYAESLSVEQLASDANMSISAFHHNFKVVTSISPLQYLKNYRLHKARMLMIYEGHNASSSALQVGYESASQFSREFKRYFGVTPTDDIARMREGNVTGIIESNLE